MLVVMSAERADEQRSWHMASSECRGHPVTDVDEFATEVARGTIRPHDQQRRFDAIERSRREVGSTKITDREVSAAIGERPYVVAIASDHAHRVAGIEQPAGDPRTDPPARSCYEKPRKCRHAATTIGGTRTVRSEKRGADQAIELGGELIQAIRLGQESVSLALTREHLELVARECREQHHGHVRCLVARLEEAAQLDTRHLRHRHVREDDVGTPVAEARRETVDVRAGADVVASLRQGRAGEVQTDLAVVDQQDLVFRGRQRTRRLARLRARLLRAGLGPS
jgi:hypothetical protein